MTICDMQYTITNSQYIMTICNMQYIITNSQYIMTICDMHIPSQTLTQFVITFVTMIYHHKLLRIHISNFTCIVTYHTRKYIPLHHHQGSILQNFITSFIQMFPKLNMTEYTMFTIKNRLYSPSNYRPLNLYLNNHKTIPARSFENIDNS